MQDDFHNRNVHGLIAVVKQHDTRLQGSIVHYGETRIISYAQVKRITSNAEVTRITSDARV
jgi:hypothetical protein